jgi:hypothetical protein
MYNAVLEQVFQIKIVQFCQFLNTACFVTDSSPVMADKKRGQCAFGQKCTYPGVNHAQDLYQSVISTIAVSCV